MKRPSLEDLSGLSKRSVLLPMLGIAAIGLVSIPVGAQLGWFRSGSGNSKLDELTTTVRREKLALKIKASANISPRQTVNLSPKTAGRVMALLVEQGDVVQQGQVVARMDSADLEKERMQMQAKVMAEEARLRQFESPNRPELQRQVQADVDRSQSELARTQSEIDRASGEIARANSEVVRVEGLIADAQSALRLAQSQRKRQEELVNNGAIARNTFDEFVRREEGAQQSVRQAQAQLKAAQAQRQQAEAQLSSARQLQSQARSQVEGTEARKEQQGQSGSDGDIVIQQAQVEAARAQLKSVEQRIEDTVIRAPFGGLVTQRYASIGAFVTPTTQASAATSGSGATSTSIIAIASELEVIAKVPEVDIGQIQPNQVADITVDAFPDETFKGQVRLVSPEAIEERDVRFFQVRLKLLTGQKQLRSGMNADLDFAGPEADALLVPTVAIVTKKGRPGVLIPDDQGKPKFKPVTVGNTQSGRVRPKRKPKDGSKPQDDSQPKDEGKPKDEDKPKEEKGDKNQGRTQVTEGLKEGDRVFIKLPDGLKLDQILKDDTEKKL